ncbi:hypothetical protein KGM_214676 [Danaus plexippus plexippus]|uniref:Uncharacterized protein n=1 Tax=Danaus plexippus plexippus TaxID=278856 RepID=A0A212FLS0_DANPL|nr:hypothetical protein KGM_214676 [Danaus plexippus plexippus]
MTLPIDYVRKYVDVDYVVYEHTTHIVGVAENLINIGRTQITNFWLSMLRVNAVKEKKIPHENDSHFMSQNSIKSEAYVNIAIRLTPRFPGTMIESPQHFCVFIVMQYLISKIYVNCFVNVCVGYLPAKELRAVRN